MSEIEKPPLDRAFEFFKRFWAFIAAIPLAYGGLYFLPNDSSLLKAIIAIMIPILVFMSAYSYYARKSRQGVVVDEVAEKGTTQELEATYTPEPVLGPNTWPSSSIYPILETCVEVLPAKRRNLPFNILRSAEEVQVRIASTAIVAVSIHDKWHVDRDDYRSPYLPSKSVYSLSQMVDLQPGGYSLSIQAQEQKAKVKVQLNIIVS